MKVRVIVVLVFCVFLFTGKVFASYPYANVCPNGYAVFPGDYYDNDKKYWVDVWKFGQCECVSYAAWKINEFMGRDDTDPVFTNSYQVYKWGSAYGWKSPVDDETFAHFSRNPEYLAESNPSYPWKSYGNGGVFDVRAIVAWWDKGSGGLSNGHVGWIDKINWNDDETVASIVVSEYNWDVSHGPGNRTLYPGSTDYPDGFLYIVTDTLLECSDTDLCKKDGGSGGQGGSGPYPNLRIWSVGVFDSAGNELHEQQSYLTVGTTYRIDVYPISEEENCVNGVDSDTENIETDIYYKISHEDSDGEWKFLKRVYTRPSTLTKDDPHKETAYFTIPSEAKNMRVYFRAKVDSTGEVHEIKEDDNWSYWQKEWYPVAGSFDLIISTARLTNGRTALHLGDHYGLEMAVRNQGTVSCSVETRSAYYRKKPGEVNWVLVATDGSGASELTPGRDQWEITLNEPFIADVLGVHQVMVCADYLGAAPESHETNNCTTFNFEVVPVGVDLATYSLSKWLIPVISGFLNSN